MKFFDVVEEIQKQNKVYILFIRCGMFFCAIGKDAVIVNRLLGLKPVCAKKEVCKCGIPVNSFKNYISKFKDSGYSYIIYYYDKNISIDKEKNYKELARIEGKMIEEKKICINCSQCNNYKNNFENTIDNNLKIIEKMLNGKK